MADFPYDLDVTNAGLAASGSDYRVPGMSATSAPMQAAPGASMAPPAAPPPAAKPATFAAPVAPTPASAPPTAQPLPPAGQKPVASNAESAPSGPDVGETVAKKQAASAAADAAAKNAQTAKIGALVGTVLSVYTGNYAGAANGAMAFKQAGDQEKAAGQ